MKKAILLAGLFAFGQNLYAQCDKPVTFTSNTARDFKNDRVRMELPVRATITLGNGLFKMTATFEEGTETVEGKIQEISVCEWEEYLKNGRSQYKVLAAKGQEGPQNGTVEIEGKDGSITITMHSDRFANAKLQFDVAEYSIGQAVNQRKSPQNTGKKR